jgi:hypothetical protein
MAFSRRYTLAEVKGMLQIFEGNRSITGVNPHTHTATRAANPAHAVAFHGGSGLLDMTARVNTPGEPRSSGTYWSQDDQAAATLEILNSFQGQIALRRLDIGETSATIESTLVPARYRMSTATDLSSLAGPGQLARANPGRVGQGAVHATTYAARGFVKVVKGVGNLMQIQTSYPIS